MSTRAGFGQQGDLSSLFTAFYEADLANRERLARDLERRNDERQDAKDQEMFSKYQHGEISGADIIAYIRTRVNQTKGDPDEHSKWTDALRDYEDAVATQNAEDAFANGGSIHNLIEFYRERQRSVKKGSPIYSEATQRLNDLIDQAAGDDLFMGEQRIMQQISEGKSSYQDLVSFYARQRRNLRPNSSLYDDVTARLNNARETVNQQQTETELAKIDFDYKAGMITADEANRRMTAAAATFQISDPARYWSLLQQGQSYLLDAEQNGIPNPDALSGWPGGNGIINRPPGGSAPSSAAEAFVRSAARYLGMPYKLGAEGKKNGIDCSGLIFRAFMDSNLGDLIGGQRKRARNYQAMFANEGQFTKNFGDLRRGDLVMYGNGSHIGIYLGNGKVMSALTGGSGVTIHSINGISTPVTGYLIVDWSKSQNTPTIPPRRPSQPSQPGRGPANTPDEAPQRPTQPLPPQVIEENDPGPSRTDSTGNPLPYGITMPRNREEAEAARNQIILAQDRALDMQQRYLAGDQTYADGTPLTDSTVKEALNDAYVNNQFRVDLSLALEDNNGAQAAYRDQASLGTGLLQLGDKRQDFFLNTILSNMGKTFDYSNQYDIDPNRSLAVVQHAIDVLTNFGAKLNVGDPGNLDANGDMVIDAPGAVTSDFKANIDGLIAAMTNAMDPNAAQVDVDLPDGLKDVITGVRNVAQAAQGVNDGTMVITVVDGAFTAVPSRAEMLPNGNEVLIPNIPGTTRSSLVPVVIQRNGAVETIWVQPEMSPSVGQGLNQLQVADGADPSALFAFLPSLFANASQTTTTTPSRAQPKPPPAGTVITAQDLANINPQDVQRLIASGALVEAPMLWRSVVLPAYDPDGPTRYVSHEDHITTMAGTDPLIAESRWYQDPETLSWYKDKLPIRVAQPDGFGGVRIDRDTGAAIVWQAGASGVPVISVADPKATQEAYDTGLLDGLLPPPIYRDHNGVTTNDPTLGLVPDPTSLYDKSKFAANTYMQSQAYRDFRAGERGDGQTVTTPVPVVAAKPNDFPDPLANGPIWGTLPSKPTYNLGTLGQTMRSTLDSFLGSSAFRDFRAEERAPVPKPIPAYPNRAKTTATATKALPPAPKITVGKYTPPKVYAPPPPPPPPSRSITGHAPGTGPLE